MKRAQLQATIEVSCDVDTAKPSGAVCKVLRRKIMLAATAGVFAVGNDPKSVGYHVRVVEMTQISRDDMRPYFEL